MDTIFMLEEAQLLITDCIYDLEGNELKTRALEIKKLINHLQDSLIEQRYNISPDDFSVQTDNQEYQEYVPFYTRHIGED
jgi:hypothetical protein